MQTNKRDLGFLVEWANGSVASHATYDDAADAVLAKYPEAEIGHDGDLSDGGDRTLCWACEADAANDAGAHSIATVRRIECR